MAPIVIVQQLWSWQDINHVLAGTFFSGRMRA
jgi:hypothetical protein